jgi:hypothetical protein
MPSDKEEIKLIAKSNTQIKFYNSNRYSDVTKKVAKLLSVLGATIVSQDLSSDRKKPARHDVHFDHEWLLAERMHSVSIRNYTEPGPRASLTVKLGEGKEHSGNITYLGRTQYKTELSEEDAKKYMAHGIRHSDLKLHFPGIDLDLEDDDLLQPKGDTFMRRSTITFRTGDEQYTISVDKFYFHDLVSDKYSETFVEVEIDCTDNKKPDQILSRVIEAMECMLDVEMQPISKYQRFREFCDADQFEEFFFIGVDLVSYSQNESWKQKQVVQRFHKIIKDSVPMSTRRRPIMLSIGDGAIVATPSDWPNIERIMRKIKSGVEKNNAQDELRKIEFRIAVHFGSVFTFTDLNDGMNVAGEGINVVSRVLDKSSNGKCLLSDQAYKRIIDSNPVDKEKFKSIGVQEFKHGLQLAVYEYDIA